MKNLATCDLYEFLSQTNKIRHSVKEWLTLTDVMNIRARQPVIPEGATKEEKEKLYSQKAAENIDAMLEAVLEKHPNETAELLALCCFVEPGDIRSHQTKEYLGAFSDMIGDEEVLRFFGSLMRLAQTAGLTA